jgi:hypothetical protein
VFLAICATNTSYFLLPFPRRFVALLFRDCGDGAFSYA